MSYAKLGNSCHTSADVLTSSTKFFPLNNRNYYLPYTLMQQYPAYSKLATEKAEEEENKEIKKMPTEDDIAKRGYGKSFRAPRGCCGS